MSQGWIKLHRGLLEWEWYDDINTKVVFLHLLLKANHKEKKYRGKIIKIGQVMTGRELLSRETGLTQQQIRTALNKLKSTNEITIDSTSQGTIIQVVKYKDYQLATKEATNEQPTSNQRVTTNNNVKNIKNENIIDNTFNEFWDLYDKKSDRKKCLSKWSKLKDEDKKEIIRILPTYKKLTPDVQYRKNPLTFLNSETWRDEKIQSSYKPLPKNKYEAYIQELKEDESKKVDTIKLLEDLKAELITPEQYKKIKEISDTNYIKFVNRA